MRYAELAAQSNFSFLQGASSADELVAMAASLGHDAIGIADVNTLAGTVRAHMAAKAAGLRLLVGARLSFADDTPEMICYPRDRAGWGQLCRLLSLGKQRAVKGECTLFRDDLQGFGAHQMMLVLPPKDIDQAFTAFLAALVQRAGLAVYCAAARRFLPDDAQRLQLIAVSCAHSQATMLAVNQVLYHAASRRPLQDVMNCIRHGTKIIDSALNLEINAERHLKSPVEMARLFASHPEAIEAQTSFIAQVNFSLDELTYEYPDEPVPAGRDADEHLAALTWLGAADRYKAGIAAKIRATIDKELALIKQLSYARYFLTVHDIVQFARKRGILCQGRGSAANSAVCFALGITAVDPTEIDLLFERFVSAERSEPPDIDVDFEHERREEVIQYLYQRYGRERAAIAATVIHYRPRSAIRDVGRVFGLAEDAWAALAAQSWNPGDELWSDDRVREAGLDPDSAVMRHVIELARLLIGCPRHLSQHVGGFVLTKYRLDETVPIGPAAMAGRSFIEWDKDDIDALGMMKVDVLALGMLSCIRKAFTLLGIADLADVPREDKATYQMLSRGDSLGVFQVESRAQMNMLPRLKPATFYDLVIEVAIVRPGPIQGDMVHPYLRRRQGREAVHFPSPDPRFGPADELERVLGKTLGVPLFQEQAMRIAIEAAKFSPGEANDLRRAMATFRHVGTIQTFYAKMVDGMTARGYERRFAEACFRQIEGFGTYGFPESHAASFAQLVYVSAWLKCHYPVVFACALLNAQPMGFYAPAQIIRDAREHGVSVRPIDVNASDWDCTIEQGALRLGLRMIDGFRADWATQLQAARGTGWRDYAGLSRAGLPQAALVALAQADAMRSLGLDRRAATWRVTNRDNPAELPLFAALENEATKSELPAASLGEQVTHDYQVSGFSLRAHPMALLREQLSGSLIMTCTAATGMRDGARVTVAGLVTVRQRPGTAKGTMFITIEDETGIANIIVWPSLIEPFRQAIIGASLLEITGMVQKSEENVVHIVAEKLADRSALIGTLDTARSPGDELPPQRAPARHPRAERVIRKSRDFH